MGNSIVSKRVAILVSNDLISNDLVSNNLVSNDTVKKRNPELLIASIS